MGYSARHRMTNERSMLSEDTHDALEQTWVPRVDDWRPQGLMDRDPRTEAGASGRFGASTPEGYGGSGGSCGHGTVIIMGAAGASLASRGCGAHTPITAYNILRHGSEDQKSRWPPKMVTGALVAAPAMTELASRYGRKGIRTESKTDTSRGARGIVLTMVAADMPGHRRSRTLEKLHHAHNGIADLFFEDVPVPPQTRLGGEERDGVHRMMELLPQERLAPGCGGVSALERASAYAAAGGARGGSIFDTVQTTTHTPAHGRADAPLARAFDDMCVTSRLRVELTNAQASLHGHEPSGMRRQVHDDCARVFGCSGRVMKHPIAAEGDATRYRCCGDRGMAYKPVPAGRATPPMKRDPVADRPSSGAADANIGRRSAPTPSVAPPPRLCLLAPHTPFHQAERRADATTLPLPPPPVGARPGSAAAARAPYHPRFVTRETRMTDAYIYDAIRTPRGKGRKDGSLHEVTAMGLSAHVLNALKERSGLAGDAVEDVIWGNATQVGEQGGCLARTAVLASDLDERVPGLSINRFCASGLEAVNLAANQVRGGAGEGYIAGGVEMMSRVPMGSDGAAIAVDPSVAMKTYFVPQGISADIIATMHGFSRDDVDSFAVESQRRAAMAWGEERFARSVVKVTDQNGLDILDRDEHMRPDTDMQSLGGLRPAFKDMGEVMPGFDAVALLKYPQLERIEHVHHAGNSSGIVDGSAGLLIGSKAFGERHGITPRARIRATAKIGTDPTIMLTGPVPVTEKILRETGMEIGDIDIFEVNEAFASVVMLFMEHFDADHARVNPNGGAIAMGHPLGATGAMILGTALDELERSGKGTALATLCVASGMGAATIIERV